MKKTAENRYPYSATLFRFCKEALEIKYDGNVKVIDQDVGTILGYDPADCSHWKKGKKNIRALSTLRSIADHLDIDERLLIDIASGKIGLEEAIFEYRGYGHFDLRGSYLEVLKKEFFKNPDKWQREQNQNFDDLFRVNRQGVSKIANAILGLGVFDEAPVYLPEVISLFTNLHLAHKPELQEVLLVEKKDGNTFIQYRDKEMRPYVRFLIAKELFKHLCLTKHDLAKDFSTNPDEVIDIEANIFAGNLLIPEKLLHSEVNSIDSSMDIISQLSRTFWVSNALMNQRLRDYMKN